MELRKMWNTRTSLKFADDTILSCESPEILHKIMKELHKELENNPEVDYDWPTTDLLSKFYY